MDGIIVTHSSFERIGMSGEYQEKFLRERSQNMTNYYASMPQIVVPIAI